MKNTERGCSLAYKGRSLGFSAVSFSSGSTFFAVSYCSDDSGELIIISLKFLSILFSNFQISLNYFELINKMHIYYNLISGSLASMGGVLTKIAFSFGEDGHIATYVMPFA